MWEWNALDIAMWKCSNIIMSANKSYLQKLVLKTTTLLKKAPVLTVPQALRAANFSSTQSTDPALQMRVRRMLPSRKNVDDITPR